MKPPKLIELKPADVEAILERVEKGALQEGDYEIFKGLIEAFVYLSQAETARMLTKKPVDKECPSRF